METDIRRLTDLILIYQPTITKEQQKQANSIARRSGHGRATHVILGQKNCVLGHTPYGYVKDTTGEYVSAAYRSNFGWKNTHYVSAETVVEIKFD